jgi:hypothetical protein
VYAVGWCEDGFKVGHGRSVNDHGYVAPVGRVHFIEGISLALGD